MSKFKVGDEVVMKTSNEFWPMGDIGIILGDGGDDDFRVKFADGEIWFCQGIDFELVEPKVYITGGGSGGGAFAGGSGVTLGYGSSRLADALRKDMPLGISGDSVTIYPNPPHKHQIEIIAWANGADIEYWDRVNESFKAVRKPNWYESLTYRIKPTQTPLQIEIGELEAKLVKLKGQL